MPLNPTGGGRVTGAPLPGPELGRGAAGGTWSPAPLPTSRASPLLTDMTSLQLQRSMRADSLNDKIAHRPTPEELIKKGVLDEDPRSPEEKYAEAIEDEYAKREGGA